VIDSDCSPSTPRAASPGEEAWGFAVCSAMQTAPTGVLPCAAAMCCSVCLCVCVCLQVTRRVPKRTLRGEVSPGYSVRMEVRKTFTPGRPGPRLWGTGACASAAAAGTAALASVLGSCTQPKWLEQCAVVQGSMGWWCGRQQAQGLEGVVLCFVWLCLQAPLHYSNVMLVDLQTKRPVRTCLVPEDKAPFKLVSSQCH
jgi:hypothetical protein